MQNQYSCQINTTGYTDGLTKQGMHNSFTYLAQVNKKEISGNGLVNWFIIKNLNCNVALCFFINTLRMGLLNCLN